MSLRLWLKKKFRKIPWDVTQPESDVYLGCLLKFYEEFQFQLGIELSKLNIQHYEEKLDPNLRVVLLQEKFKALADKALRATIEKLGRPPRR